MTGLKRTFANMRILLNQVTGGTIKTGTLQDMFETYADYLEMTKGTGVASRAVVLDSGDDFIWPATGILTYGVLKDPAGTTLGATAAELNYLDITTLGTGAASKALVLDTSGNYSMPAAGLINFSGEALVAAGSSSSDAGVISEQMTAVTAADGVKGVALPEAATSSWHLVINTVQNQELLVYPVNAGNDKINFLLEDIAYVIPAAEFRIFFATSGIQWYVGEEKKNEKVVFFDDFLAGAVDARISSTGGAGANTEVATKIANSLSGEITMKSSTVDGNHSQNATMLTLDELNFQADQGGMAVEARVHIDNIVDAAFMLGFTDVISSTVELPVYVLSGDVDSDADNACCIGFDTDATTDEFFQAGVKATADTALVLSGSAPTNGTYVVLRLEVNAAGGIQGYIDGTPIAGGITANAITSGTSVTPYLVVANRGGAARILTVDYFRAEQNRIA